MSAKIRALISILYRFKHSIDLLVLITVIIFYSSISCSQENKLSKDLHSDMSTSTKVIYRNPQVMNVDYSFEFAPDPKKIDRKKDLKLWMPIPREWDSQKAVKIISVEPPPHAKYQDPEHGNKMWFWDFGKGPEKPSYKVDIKFRLESYEIHGVVDPGRIGPYDKASKEYAFYTRSSHTIPITPKVKELARIAVGEEKNPYLQAKRIAQFVSKKMRYAIIGFEKGERGIKPLLENPVINEKTGEEFYRGSCSENSSFFIALCRAVGIPARAVVGFVGWNPGIKEKDLKRKLPAEFEVSPLGLAGTQDYFPCSPHQWAEFYIPNYGWIPRDDPQPEFGHLKNGRVIMSKGMDIKLGPYAPLEQDDGYGFQWVLINDGRVDSLMTGVWNIARIHAAIAKILHRSDPFPADGIALYNENLFPEEDTKEHSREWRQGVLSEPSRFARGSVSQNLDIEQFCSKNPRFRGSMEAFVCHMLSRQLGDERFRKLVDAYLDLRQKSNKPVSTSSFRKLAEDVSSEQLDWFFSQWVNAMDLPRLRLEQVVARKEQYGWRVQGRLVQSGSTAFRLPIEIALVTKDGNETHKVWIDSKALDFDLHTQSEPQKLIVDPEFEILKIQRMPPRLWWYWDGPDMILIYGTLTEAEANKAAVERLNTYYFGLGPEKIKADTDVTEADLRARCVMLFGRPETNKVTKALKDVFPIKFEKNTFLWQGTTYDQPTQGVAQIVENPYDSKNWVILYAGLSGDATLKLFDFAKLETDQSGWFPHEADGSYYIYDGYKKLAIGDWQEYDSNLVWKFK
jgi:transglutaminase-like putative cysteine protease